MTEYLLNSNLLIALTVCCTMAWFLFASKVLRLMPRRYLAIAAVVSALLFLLVILIIRRTFGMQSTPAGSYYIAFASICALLFTGLSWKKRKALLYGSAAAACSLLLLAVSINDYYQYFPTINSMFIAQRRHPAETTNLTAHQRPKATADSIENGMFGSQQNHGNVVTTDIPGTVSHLNARPGYIYLPPSYGDAGFKNVKFPVLVLLTGTPGSPESWLQGGQFASIMDKFADHHRGITPIVVIADHSGSFNNDTECVDSPHGNADTYLTQDLPAFMKQKYRVLNDPANWGIGGFSEGGMCAAMLTLKHQNVFRHFLDLSGDPFPYLNDTSQTLPVLFNGSKQAQQASDIDWLLANQKLNPGLTAQFAIGANDNKRLISEMEHTYRLAVEHKVTSSFESVAHEGHSFSAWSKGYADAVPKLSYYLGATECDAGCTQ